MNVAYAKDCSDFVELTWDNHQIIFKTEIANTFKLRKKGLQGREFLPELSAMLFVFDESGRVRLWMKNTDISLDMLFFNERGFLRKIHKNSIPQSLDIINGGYDIKFALEVNAGIVEKIKIPIGAHLQILENNHFCKM